MRENTVSSQNVSQKRGNLLPVLITGVVIGLIGGAPLGWFSHLIYYRYHSAQVLVCRQQHFGQPDAQLQALCGSLY